MEKFLGTCPFIHPNYFTNYFSFINIILVSVTEETTTRNPSPNPNPNPNPSPRHLHYVARNTSKNNYGELKDNYQFLPY